MALSDIDHVAVAVHSLEEAVGVYERLLGVEAHRETVPDQGVTIAAFHLDRTRIELLEPLTDDNSIARFLENNGEGIHHLALRSDDVEIDLKHARDEEITCIDTEPRRGAGDYRIAFLHPKDLHGTLLELAQPPADASRED